MLGQRTLPKATKVEFDEDSFWVSLTDGRTVGVPLAWFPRLLSGDAEGRIDYFISPNGIHWESLDEDIAIATILGGSLETSAARAA
jgi:Protein of unknown function (DUF2442)